jgi:ligand-binding SRPBCC domain-containing protein
VRVRETIDIAAPVERVFAWFDDLDNAEVLVPNLVAITKVEPLDNGGRRVVYRVETRSDVIDASSEHLEYDPPRRTVTRGLQSGVSTTATREFESVDGGTHVTASVEWDIPIRYVARLVTAPLRGPLRRSLRAGLAAAKGAFEERA